jgi:hypothetical protein
MAHILGPDLGDFPVLAVEAAEIAPGRRNGKSSSGRQKMKQGFFLNRIHVGRTGIAVRQAVQGAIQVHPAPAHTAVPRQQPAAVGAQGAHDGASVQPIEVVGRPGPFPQGPGRIILENRSLNVRRRSVGRAKKRPAGMTGSRVAEAGRSSEHELSAVKECHGSILQSPH